MTMLIPVVVAVVKLNESYFNLLTTNYIDLPNLNYLFWSLLAISTAQTLYAIFCPRIIKKYGSDQELYIIESLQSLPTSKLDKIKDACLLSFYKSTPDGPMSFAISPDDKDFDQLFYRAIKTSDSNPSGPQIDKFKSIYSVFWYSVRNGAFYYDRQNVQSELYKLEKAAPGLITVRETIPPFRENDFNALIKMISNHPDQIDYHADDWKKTVLHWSFKKSKYSKPIIIGLVGCLYGVGFSYLGFKTIQNVIFMASLQF